MGKLKSHPESNGTQRKVLAIVPARERQQKSHQEVVAIDNYRQRRERGCGRGLGSGRRQNLGKTERQTEETAVEVTLAE